MNDLAKLVSDIRGLTADEADELAGMLGRRPAPERSADAAGDVMQLTDEDWLVAEALSLQAEAAALSRSLDETLAFVSSGCRSILEGP